MKKFITVVEIYNFLLILLLIGTGARDSSNTAPLLATTLFVPVLAYFLLVLIKKIPSLYQKLPGNYAGPQKMLAVYGFIFSSILFASLLANIKTPLELLLGTFLLPLVMYFIFLFTITLKKTTRKKKGSTKIVEKNESDVPLSKEVVKAVKKEPGEIEEKDRRAFLKLIAGAGFGFLVTSLINPQKAGAAFFGSVPGPGVIGVKDSTGVKIDPAIKSPTDGYGIMNIDDASAPYYYGFVNKDGAWYIVKEVGDGSFQYAKGASSYNWSNRASETYASYNTTF